MQKYFSLGKRFEGQIVFLNYFLEKEISGNIIWADSI